MRIISAILGSAALLAATTSAQAEKWDMALAYSATNYHSEIAAETGLPLGTIKSRIRLALDRLRQKMS